jgi:hypothetical protein
VVFNSPTPPAFTPTELRLDRSATNHSLDADLPCYTTCGSIYVWHKEEITWKKVLIIEDDSFTKFTSYETAIYNLR